MICKKIVNKLKRNNKKIMIESSGSIKGNTLEKVRNGQSYLYQKEGSQSEIIEIRLYRKIRGGPLNQALLDCIYRFPYFNTRLVELDGDFYIVKNNNSLIARKTNRLLPLGSLEVGRHLIDVTYFKKSIFVSFHHSLCDGRGIKPFVESLIYYYSKYRYNSKASSTGIRLKEDKLLEGETLDPFFKRYDVDSNNLPNIQHENGYILEEDRNHIVGEDNRREIIIDKMKFMKLCHENNSTPSVLISILMSKAIDSVIDKNNDPIVANVACDIRMALDEPNTFKNCVRTIELPYTDNVKKMNLKQQSTYFKNLLHEQRNKDYLRHKVNKTLSLYENLDSLHSYVEKQKMMNFFEGMLTPTYVISYLGQFILNENQKYVDEIHLYNSGAAGLGITIVATEEKFCINIKQSFDEDKYANAFVRFLTKLNVVIEAREKVFFKTPNDRIIKR